MTSLPVYLQGKRIGELLRAGGLDCAFAYAPEYLAERGPDAIALSPALALRGEPFGPAATRAYLEGLLPQGERREAIAAELGLDPHDAYGLIAELGGDCIGAVTVGHREEELAAAEPPGWLTDAELEEVLQPWPEPRFDPDDPWRMRFALPGERHKLALVHDEASQRWAWPRPGLPSTHIVKPEDPERPGLVAGEHACSLAYSELGLPVVHTALATIAGRPCLLSKRFDRWGEWPRVERLHQVSFAQALGIAPGETHRRLSPGTPCLSEVSDLLRAIGEEGAVETLMRATFCDLLIGCATLRGANLGLLLDKRPMLAPLYGSACTELYGDIRPRPIVVGEDVPPAPLLIDIRYTIELCGFEFQPALIDSVRLMAPLCSALNEAAKRAVAEGWNHPAVEDTLQIALSRTMGFRHESIYLKPRE